MGVNLKSALISATSPATFIPGTDIDSQVYLGRILVGDFDSGTGGSVTIEDGLNVVLMTLTLPIGNFAPLSIDLGITSGNGFKLKVNHASVRVYALYHHSSKRIGIPNGY